MSDEKHPAPAEEINPGCTFEVCPHPAACLPNCLRPGEKKPHYNFETRDGRPRRMTEAGFRAAFEAYSRGPVNAEAIFPADMEAVALCRKVQIEHGAEPMNITPGYFDPEPPK